MPPDRAGSPLPPHGRDGAAVARVGVTGHQSLPAAAARLLRERLDALVPGPDVVMLTSLAAGTDQLCAEHVVGVGGRLHVIVPSDDYESTFLRRADRDRYRRLLSAAAEVEQLAFDEPSEEAFLAAGRRVAEECDWLLAAWDGEPSRGLGGTADVVAYAGQIGKRVEVVWPKGLRRVPAN